MFRARLNEVETERITLDDTAIEMISARSWLRFEVPGFGFGFDYHRPLRVESPRGTVAIRDHVMLARVAAIGVALALTIRRFLP